MSSDCMDALCYCSACLSYIVTVTKCLDCYKMFGMFGVNYPFTAKFPESTTPFFSHWEKKKIDLPLSFNSFTLQQLNISPSLFLLGRWGGEVAFPSDGGF